MSQKCKIMLSGQSVSLCKLLNNFYLNETRKPPIIISLSIFGIFIVEYNLEKLDFKRRIIFLIKDLWTSTNFNPEDRLLSWELQRLIQRKLTLLRTRVCVLATLGKITMHLYTEKLKRLNRFSRLWHCTAWLYNSQRTVLNFIQGIFNSKFKRLYAIRYLYNYFLCYKSLTFKNKKYKWKKLNV